MIRNIVKIDEDKCVGCGLCITACQEGALELVNGKAKLISDSYCDGLGNCLPACPTNAIIIEERAAEAFDEEAVVKRMESANTSSSDDALACGCPGSNSRMITPRGDSVQQAQETVSAPSQLRQWPCQIKLVPVNAPYFANAHILIAADCTAYAYANIHEKFMRNKITLIGCPKLDDTDYSEKLTNILKRNEIKSITVLRMEVPCCGGIVHAVKKALVASGKLIPWGITTISTDGTIIEE